MSTLAVGDRVQVVDPASGKVGYEEIYLFGHQLSDATATFVKATLENGKVLTLSPDHFVPAVPMGKAVAFKNTVMMRGKDLLVGMHVFAAGGESAAASMVKHIGVSAEQGLFNPKKVTRFARVGYTCGACNNKQNTATGLYEQSSSQSR